MPSKRFKRILLKVGGEAMMGDRNYGIDPVAALEVAEKIKQIYTEHVQIAIVIGGGNIFRGVAGSKQGIDRATADYIGMMATVMNGLALQDALEQIGVPTRLQSALLMPSVAENFIRRKAIRHIEKGRVVILGAGTGVPYVTTDTGASLHALELHCDILMKATKVDGIYDKDPSKYDNARRFETLTFADAIQMTNVEIMDTSALAMSMENNMPLMVFKLFDGDNLLRAVKGENIGTYVSNDVKTKFVQ
ncbi:MAG: UMP kinase [Candidatus Pacebacteria bacterium CG_4_10_14_3_um_filter_34_15]|nr:UMP kinase [Candidatus Pacearchaeota archaeon]NCQ65488.1 UMP kinase [Candidatus Paceibacterota bacterium]OIO45369.1 MAG: UMP kinase [Candidatus Pacebacteria bacterium CG1_02_43_31]PIQ80633.1 MAG: UMP kinase [Candidatus Pacebacteria bacterium CG11_big_fil_rev_8_21_14_0_20_34_55]PIX81244.1 MAG: UMP kinase [Candidatus Pacebacteria bacterium CG_4_10_14_3_um_filter_34_15]PJC43984.1 MAG: UMP kinase [Candidatus Pacebacteria bacterium CG_4_9_14_0_2_um_filter_34_50]